MTDPRNEQAAVLTEGTLEHALDVLGGAYLTPAERRAFELVRALYPRPADARVPEGCVACGDSAQSVVPTKVVADIAAMFLRAAEGVTEKQAAVFEYCADQLKRTVLADYPSATPPAAKPEQGDDDYESDDRFVGHLYADAPEVAQPKPAGDLSPKGLVGHNCKNSFPTVMNPYCEIAKPAGEAVDAEDAAAKLADDRAYRIADHFAEDYVRSSGVVADDADGVLVEGAQIDEMMSDCISHLAWRGIASADEVSDYHVIVRFNQT